MHTGIHEAWTVLGQAFSFTARHYVVVLALGGLASLQRFLAVGGDERFAWAGGVPGEVFTGVVRVLFLVWVVRTMFAGAGVSWSQAGPRLSAFAGSHAPMLVASGVALVLLTLVAKGIPDGIAATLDGDARATFQSWELAIKNVTVIPFTMIWMTAIARVAVVGGTGTLALEASRVSAG